MAPLAIHSQGGDRDDWGTMKSQAIRGLPFTRKFEQHIDRAKMADQPRFSREFLEYVEHRRLSTPLTKGMASLYNRRGRQTDEFRIAYAIVSGATDPEHVRIVLLGSPHKEYFEACAIRSLSFIYEKIMAELATAKDPDAPAGAA